MFNEGFGVENHTTLLDCEQVMSPDVGIRASGAKINFKAFQNDFDKERITSLLSFSTLKSKLFESLKGLSINDVTAIGRWGQ